MTDEKKKRNTLKSQYREKCVDIYFRFHKYHNGVEPNWKGEEGGKQGRALNSILLYIKKQVEQKKGAKPTSEEVFNAWKYILLNFQYWNKFQQQNLKCTQINSEISNIIGQIKKGKEQEKSKSIYKKPTKLKPIQVIKDNSGNKDNIRKMFIDSFIEWVEKFKMETPYPIMKIHYDLLTENNIISGNINEDKRYPEVLKRKVEQYKNGNSERNIKLKQITLAQLERGEENKIILDAKNEMRKIIVIEAIQEIVKSGKKLNEILK